MTNSISRKENINQNKNIEIKPSLMLVFHYLIQLKKRGTRFVNENALKQVGGNIDFFVRKLVGRRAQYLSK